MVVQFRKWGHSVAIRVPHQLLKEIGAVEGMSAEIAVRNGQLVVVPLVETPNYELATLLAGIDEEDMHGEVQTGAVVGNEFA